MNLREKIIKIKYSEKHKYIGIHLMVLTERLEKLNEYLKLVKLEFKNIKKLNAVKRFKIIDVSNIINAINNNFKLQLIY